MYVQRNVQNTNEWHNKYYKVNIHVTTTKTRSQSIANIPSGSLLWTLRSPTLDGFFKFGANSLRGFPTLIFPFLSLVHPLKEVRKVIALNIQTHWTSTPSMYLRVWSRVNENKNDQENCVSCTENVNRFFSKMPGCVGPCFQPGH